MLRYNSPFMILRANTPGSNRPYAEKTGHGYVFGHKRMVCNPQGPLQNHGSRGGSAETSVPRHLRLSRKPLRLFLQMTRILCCSKRYQQPTTYTSLHGPVHESIVQTNTLYLRHWLYNVDVSRGSLRPRSKAGRYGETREHSEHYQRWHHPCSCRAGGLLLRPRGTLPDRMLFDCVLAGDW